MSEIYRDGSYIGTNPTWHVEDSAWKAGQIVRMIERHGLKPRSIAEVGCGAGEILFQLARNLGAEVRCEGFDISPDAIRLCESRQMPNLAFHQLDLASSDLHFDLLLAIDVVEHVDDYIGFLRALKRRAELKIFHFPLDLSVQTVLRVKPILATREKVGHLHYFSRETALATLAYTGYEVLDSFYTPTQVELSGRGWKAGLLQIPRRIGHFVAPHLTARILGGSSLLALAR
jgi:SAM-dependent methyltransferase